MQTHESAQTSEIPPINLEKRTHPLVNSLKWLTGAVIPVSVGSIEGAQYYLTGTSTTISTSFPILLADGLFFLGLVIGTPQDMGQGTGEYLKNNVIKPGLSLYQTRVRIVP
jgi:hypothetical protein